MIYHWELLESQFYCKISAANFKRNMSVKEFLDKVWGRVYWLRKKNRKKMRTLGAREKGNKVEMKRGRKGDS